MRVQLEIQEGIDLRLEQRDEELHQLRSQSQADGAQLAALSPAWTPSILTVISIS